MRNLALALAALLASCAAPQRTEVARAPQAERVSSDALGLSKTSVFEVPAPPPVVENGAIPGEVPLLPRDYPGAAPVIPHDTRDFTPITASQNSCTDCHATKVRDPGGPTPIPESHYTNLRDSPGKAGETIVGARFVCTSCHVPRTDAKPLVGNSFLRSAP